MFKESYPYYLAGRPAVPDRDLAVTDKYTGETIATTALADGPAVDRASEAAVRAAPAMASLASYERRAALEHCTSRFKDRAEEFAQVLCLDAGKTIRDSRGEVARLTETRPLAIRTPE